MSPGKKWEQNLEIIDLGNGKKIGLDPSVWTARKIMVSFVEGKWHFRFL